MRPIIIGLAILGLAFVAFMLLGSNEEAPPDDPSEGHEPPAFLEWLDTGRGAPRLLSSEIRFPRDTGDPFGYIVRESCGTPARLATVALLSGTNVRVIYACEPQPTDRSCSGPARLCRQELCLVASEAEKSASACDEDRTFVGEADLSAGPEPGRITIVPALNRPAEAVLR